ncbi:MAG: Na(+)-translocating NADH-quinone reductase subunit A [Flavobacteriales bacterium]|nr:Na(+)-translocating NADH-quinone reductase subunit A [Flavobacteriales bacterium]
MSKVLKIKRGADIKLVGGAEKILTDLPMPHTVAIKPSDFEGTTAKMLVKVGDEVKAGSTLFYNKDNDKIKFTSPVSGEVAEIKRGAKRVLQEVVIVVDKETKYVDFKAADPAKESRENIINKLCESGVWPFIKQRPYDVVANPNDTAKAIFISVFDSSPLAPDNDFIVHGQAATFQKGIDVLSKLAEVHLTVNNAAKADEAFLQAKNVTIHSIEGPHPAGNVGVHIHHFMPICKGEIVWTLKPQDVLTIGRLFEKGQFDGGRIVAITGAQVKTPKYYRTVLGASLKTLLADNLKEGNNRIISGNVLTGTKLEEEGYIGFYDSHITVIPEGGEAQMFGWILPNPGKFSISRALVSWMSPNKKYNLDANMNGEERPFVVTEEYDKVFPFDIFPVQLVKSIMIEDIELMENLGIYEVAPEDFALCETVCTSKIATQTIVRDGLTMLRNEMS